MITYTPVQMLACYVSGGFMTLCMLYTVVVAVRRLYRRIAVVWRVCYQRRRERILSSLPSINIGA